MKNTHIILILLFFCIHLGLAQQKTVDSLEQQLTNTTNGKTKLENLANLGLYYTYLNPEKGLKHLDEATELAKKEEDSAWLAKVYIYKASNHFALGNDSVAFNFYRTAEHILKTIDSTHALAKLTFNKGATYSQRRRHKEALITFQKALELFTKEKDTMFITLSHIQLGKEYMSLTNYKASMASFLKGKLILEQMNQKESSYYPYAQADLQVGMGALNHRLAKYDIALEHFNKALDYFKNIGDQYRIASQYLNIGTIYSDNTGDYINALNNTLEAYKIFKNTNNVEGISSALGNLGAIHLDLENYEQAISYSDSAIVINNTLKNHGLLAKNYITKGRSYFKENNFTKARIYYDSSQTNVNKIDDRRMSYFIKLALAEVNSKQGNYRTAYTALEEARILNDSLLTDEKKEEMAVLKAQYDFDKEKAILEANFQKDQAIQQARINRQVLIRNASIGGGAFLILVLAVGFLLWRIKREADYNAQLSSSKLQSLRAQINPHFIFNSLNSINDYVLKNEKQTASDYLGEFSVMVRTILENTEEEEISLEEEIKFLKSYVALEQKRLQHNFSFNVLVDQTIDTETTLLPPSLLQPFIENSIWHGISSKKDGLLSLSFTKTKDSLICTIEDNGIGLSSDGLQKGTTRKSFGLENVKNRLNLLKKAKSTNADVTIKNREEDGVSVKVTLPLSLQF